MNLNRSDVVSERVAMSTGLTPTKQYLNRRKVMTHRHFVGLLMGWSSIVLMAAACAPVPTTIPPQPLPATATPMITASIAGTVWHDLCLNDGKEENPPAGCVVDASTSNFIANGIHEPGEPGISEVRIELGLGSCPSTGLVEVKADAAGRYNLEGVWPGEYCLSVRLGGSHQPASLVPGIWTYPENGMQSLTLNSGEHQRDIDFGWDYSYLPEPLSPKPSPTPSCVDSAGFIKDVTIPDGSKIDPDDSFTKTWRLRNTGNCTWTSEYSLVFLSGDRMAGAFSVPLSEQVGPSQLVDLSVRLRAPKSVGTYRGYWMLRNVRGHNFGLGDGAEAPFSVKILIEPEITDWRGEYFDNRALEGDPLVIRNDEEVDFNWKDSSPMSSLPADNFSVRWTRRLNFDASTYRFTIRVDDGARLWVDNRMVIDEWELGSIRAISVDLEITKGKHDIKLEYFERTGDGRVHLNFGKFSVDSGDGWLAKYWFNRTMDSDWAWISTTDSIAFDWGPSSPGLGIPVDDFSASWSRAVDFEPGFYRLYARADDGIRVDIDGDRVIDEWHPSNASETYTAEIKLSGVQDVQVQYYERGGTAEANFWWEYLRPQNRPPIASADIYETMVNEVLIVPASGVLSNDEDADGDRLIASLVSGTSNGTASLDPDGSFVYLPDADFVGADEFMYRISDGEAESSATLVTITVIPGNFPPIANEDDFTVEQGNALDVPAPGVLENDKDGEGQSLIALLETDPSNGSVKLAEDGSFLYKPEEDFSGEDQFSYRASDGEATSEVAIVRIRVLPLNDVPLAVDDEVIGAQDQAIEIYVLDNDLGLGDGPIMISIESLPAEGSVEIFDNWILYTPKAGYAGEDEFTYAVTDYDGERSQARVFVLLLPTTE